MERPIQRPSVTDLQYLHWLNVGLGSVTEIPSKYGSLAKNVRYGRQLSGFPFQRAPAANQRAGTQWRRTAGFFLDIRLFGDFERIVHFNTEIAHRAFQLPVAQQ